MGRAWKKLDLRGAGLQSLNVRLAHALKRRAWAYLLWPLFPTGAHRLYLESRAGAATYLALSTACLGLWLGAGPLPALAAALPEAALAVFDLVWIDRRCVKLNKALRMKLYLGAGAAPPEGYRGRHPEGDPLQDYLQAKEGERAGHAPSGAAPTRRPSGRIPSFREQERLLRELGRRRNRNTDRDAGPE